MRCKSACDVKSGIAHFPSDSVVKKKVLGFSQVLKSIKWQDLLEEGRNGHNAFRTSAMIHFIKRSVLGLGPLNAPQGTDKLGSIKNGTMQKEI